jgi:ketosteroid isomerase-like protein
MPSNLERAGELYDAFAKADTQGLLALLHPRFEGVVSAGLPNDFGGTYHGPEAMLSECWARVFQAFDIRPVPAEFLEARDGSVVVLGNYMGHARESGNTLDAAFAHILRFQDGAIAGLRQITDSRLWAEALEPSGSDLPAKRSVS